MADRPECAYCGTWTCEKCGHKRARLRIAYPNHRCPRCGGTKGKMKPTRHLNTWRYEEVH